MKIGKILALIFVFCFSMGLTTGVSAEKKQNIVSPALNIISDNSHVAMSCIEDGVVTFEAEDFEKTLNLSYLSSITVIQIPARTDGILYLGGSEVKNGQTVSRANIGHMTFEFLGENINESSFCFTTNYSEHEIECKLYSLKYANFAPVVDVFDDVEASTYKNISVYGKLDAYDKEGDQVIFEVVKQPKNGLLKIDSDGEYVYTPINGYTGKDSFKYVAVDKYGNYSALCEQRVNVELQKSSLVYSDISAQEYHVAAINLTEKGIISAQEVDGKYYFYPHAKLGRLEYLVMGMKSLGIEIENSNEKTVFTDDAEIPENLKGYVNTAVKLGIISGKLDKNGNPIFAPNEKITRAEAAVILNNMSELDKPILTPVFADSKGLPHWAKEAIYCLSYNGIMPTNDGYVSASESLDKGEGVYMIYMLSEKSGTK